MHNQFQWNNHHRMTTKLANIFHSLIELIFKYLYANNIYSGLTLRTWDDTIENPF